MRRPAVKGEEGENESERRGHWVSGGLSCVISTSAARQSRRGWPCLERCCRRDPLSQRGWADLSHSVCPRASPPAAHTYPLATLLLRTLRFPHSVTPWKWAEDKKVAQKKKLQDHIHDSIYCTKILFKSKKGSLDFKRTQSWVHCAWAGWWDKVEQQELKAK